MTQKTVFLLAACIGLALVACLMFSGTDPEQAARSGPRWRRYLIAAALLVLAAVGFRYVTERRDGDRGSAGVTCYMPRRLPEPVLSAKERLAKLQQQLEQLDQIAALGKLDPQTVTVRLDSIEKEVLGLSMADPEFPLAPQEQDQVDNFRTEALARIALIRARFSPDLAESADWKIVAGFWPQCESQKADLLKNKGRSESWQAVKDTEAKLKDVNAALDRLRQSGLLQLQEQQLLAGETQRLSDDICVPIKIAMTCYDSALVPPERVSLSRLSNRIVLLNALLKAGKVQPCVAERLLPSLEQDLQVIVTSKIPPSWVRPGDSDPKKVEEDTRELIAKLKESLSKPSAKPEPPR